MATPQDSPFRLTGRGYVDKYLLPFLASYNVLLPHVDIEINSNLSTVVINSREFSTEGETGRYINSKTLPYDKQDLNVMYPYPMLYHGPWPTTYRALIQWFNVTYGWIIEENDFIIRPAAAAGFTPTLDTVLSFAPGLYDGTFYFSARSDSTRFKQSSTLDIIVQPTNERTRIESLYEIGAAVNLNLLSGDTESNPALPTIFTATGEACTIEGLRLMFGFVPSRDQYTLSYTYGDNSNQIVYTATALDSQGGPGRYSGSYVYATIKESLSGRLDGAIFNLDGSYPLTYESLSRYLRNNYGLAIEPGEFYIESDPTKHPLVPGDAVQFTPDSNKRDFLVVTQTSKRWAREGRITFNLLNV